MNNQIITRQISEIQTKGNVSNVTFLQENTYKVIYRPTNSNSPYSHLVFTLKVTFPNKYPESPPNIVFLTSIYHLNVDPVTGQVHMPILFDDWSPYLTLSNIFQSLDSILEQPDINYAASQLLLEQYQQDFQTYAQKLNKMIQITYPSNQNLNQSIVQHVEELDLQQNNEQFPQSNDLTSNPLYFHSQKSKEILIQQGPCSAVNQQQVINTGTFNIYYLQEMTIKDPQTKNKAYVDLFKSGQFVTSYNNSKNNLPLSHKLEQSSRPYPPCQFQTIHNNLIKNQQLVQTLIKTCQMMQNNLKSMTNIKMKQIINKQIQKQWQMVEQLFTLSSKLKLKLFNMIKKQSQQLLK